MATYGGKREGAGRKKGVPTLLAEKARAYIAEQLAKNLPPIVERAIEQAKAGDKYARDWLSDRGWGKAVQAIVTQDADGNVQAITGIVVNPPNVGKKS